MSGRATDWSFSIPATLQAAEQVFGSFQVWRAKECGEVAPFTSELLLREALTNSIVHGCGEDPTKSVFCTLRPKPGRLVIAVRDQGEGFDWRSAGDHSADVEDTHGRGLEIYRIYAHRVRFNDKGNSLFLISKSSKIGPLG